MDATPIRGREVGFGFSVRHIMLLVQDGSQPDSLTSIERFCREAIVRFTRAASRLSAIYRVEAPFGRETYGEAVAANAECTAIMHHLDNLKEHFHDEKIVGILKRTCEELQLVALDATRHFLQVQTWFQTEAVAVQVPAGLAETVGID